MSVERKHWRLPIPFRRLSGNEDLRAKSYGGRSKSRVSSVYLSDSISTNGFIVVPEFDESVRTRTIHEAYDHTLHTQNPSTVTSSSPLSSCDASSYLYGLESIGLHYGSYPGGGSRCTPVSNASRDDDLSQRLGFAYEHIRSMPSAASPSVLSSDPYILRQQLGVPQHSVFNHPIHSSPDLPNPHILPPEPMPPEPLSATSPDGSHTSLSKKLSLCIKATVYPNFPRRDYQDSIEAAPHEILIENSPPQCRTLQAPRSADNSCTPKRQPSTLKRSKLVKRRVEKYVFTPLSLPPPRPHAMRNALRKQAANTSRSTRADRLQTSLPQIRPPSPFQVDIPLHHTWHDRRTDFDSLPVCHSKMVRSCETGSRRTSENTEVLASLAWIGTPPTSSSSHTTNRRYQKEFPVFSPDRFSMVIAVEDDSISDDALVDRLERVRRIGHLPECAGEVSALRSLDDAHSPCGDENRLLHSQSPPPTSDQLAKSRDVFLPSPLLTQDPVSDTEDTEVWLAARKALLCVREIVRTEKKYQEAIRLLLNAQTATPPPPSMVPYVSALVRASETLLKCYLEDPSAWGVSTAFVASEDELEATMVSWCAVAGAFFMDGNDPRSSGLMGKWRLRKSGGISSPPLPAPQHPQTDQEGQSTSVPLSHKPDRPPSRKLSVRDLAIQPIQRVMRYVLLYRDLMECTPSTSPSRLLVERALEAATRIANRCDRAQGNPAFFHAS